MNIANNNINKKEIYSAQYCLSSSILSSLSKLPAIFQKECSDKCETILAINKFLYDGNIHSNEEVFEFNSNITKLYRLSEKACDVIAKMVIKEKINNIIACNITPSFVINDSIRSIGPSDKIYDKSLIYTFNDFLKTINMEEHIYTYSYEFNKKLSVFLKYDIGFKIAITIFTGIFFEDFMRSYNIDINFALNQYNHNLDYDIVGDLRNCSKKSRFNYNNKGRIITLLKKIVPNISSASISKIYNKIVIKNELLSFRNSDSVLKSIAENKHCDDGILLKRKLSSVSVVANNYKNILLDLQAAINGSHTRFQVKYLNILISTICQFNNDLHCNAVYRLILTDVAKIIIGNKNRLKANKAPINNVINTKNVIDFECISLIRFIETTNNSLKNENFSMPWYDPEIIKKFTANVVHDTVFRTLINRRLEHATFPNKSKILNDYNTIFNCTISINALATDMRYKKIIIDFSTKIENKFTPSSTLK